MYRFLVSVVLIGSLGLCPRIALAQQDSARNDWAAVKALAPGDKVAIDLKDGKTIKGSVTNSSDQELTMERNGKAQPIARDSIARVYRYVGKPAKGKYALIGAGIGAAAGTGAGAIKYSPHSDDSEIYIGMGLMIGAGIGALAGMAFGAAKRRQVLIYESK